MFMGVIIEMDRTKLCSNIVALMMGNRCRKSCTEYISRKSWDDTLVSANTDIWSKSCCSIWIAVLVLEESSPALDLKILNFNQPDNVGTIDFRFRDRKYITSKGFFCSFANISQCLAQTPRWIFQTVSIHCSSRPIFGSLGECWGPAIRPMVWAKAHLTDQRSKWNLVFSSKPHEAQIYVLR